MPLGLRDDRFSSRAKPRVAVRTWKVPEMKVFAVTNGAAKRLEVQSDSSDTELVTLRYSTKAPRHSTNLVKTIKPAANDTLQHFLREELP